MAWENLPSTNTPLNATNLDKITDSGSNTNGHWLKLQDGTLIQWDYKGNITDQAIASQYGGTAIYFGTRDITFPVEFHDANYAITVGAALWGTGGSWGSVMANTQKSSARLIFYDMFSRPAGTAFRLSWIAIGRWK
jgi:hypothetical protein